MNDYWYNLTSILTFLHFVGAVVAACVIPVVFEDVPWWGRVGVAVLVLTAPLSVAWMVTFA